jgi:hypothetical protein
MTQDELAKTIKSLVEKGDRAKEKSDQFYMAAGLHLLTLRAEHKGTWAEWEELVRQKCGIGKSRASELMRIAGGHTTVAEVRSDKAESMRNVRAASPQRGGEKETGRDLADIVRDHDAQRTVDLQCAWDRAPVEVKQKFIAANVVELMALLAQQRKKAASAAADRAVERALPPELAPIPDDYPELPTFLNRALAA